MDYANDVELLTESTSTEQKKSEEYYLKEIAFFALKLQKKKWFENMDYEKRHLQINCECLNEYYWKDFYK